MSDSLLSYTSVLRTATLGDLLLSPSLPSARPFPFRAEGVLGLADNPRYVAPITYRIKPEVKTRCMTGRLAEYALANWATRSLPASLSVDRTGMLRGGLRDNATESRWMQG